MKKLEKYKMWFLAVCMMLVGCQCAEMEKPCLSPVVAPCETAVIESYPARRPLNTAEKKVVLVGGVFDLIHYGHLKFLEEAKKQGNYLVVALESDKFIKHKKHRKPVHTQKQRAEILAKLRMVDEIILLEELQGYEDYLRFVEAIHPNVIVVTEGDPYLPEKKKQAAAVGAKVVTVPHYPDLSTTSALKHSKKGK